MNRATRVVLGFVLGGAMSLLALLLSRGGHGSYAPIAFAGSFVFLVPAFGVILAHIFAPILWALYFGAIPEQDNQFARLGMAIVVGAFHLGSGLLVACYGPAFVRMLHAQSLGTVAFLILAGGTLLAFGVICMRRGIKARDREV